MRAVVLRSGAVAVRDDHPPPNPLPGESLVRVVQAGVCETDLQLIRGYMGFEGVLGHEFVGVAIDGPLRGRRVVGEINNACGGCDLCARGLRTHCPHRTVLGILGHEGAFAEAVAVPAENLHAVPDDLPDDVAVFAEPVAAAYQVLEQIDVRPADRVLVLGDGRLGNLCAQVLARTGRRPTVIGRHEPKLDRLRRLGIEARLTGDAPPDRSFDVVVECTGSPSGLPDALRHVRPRGTIVLKTTVAGEQTLSLSPFVIDEVRLVGSRCGPFPRALAALARGDIDVRPLIDSRFSLGDGLAALERAAAPGVLKVLIEMGESRRSP